MSIKDQLPSLSPEEIEVLRQEHSIYFGNLAHQGQVIKTEVEDEHFVRSVESAVNAKWIKMLEAQAFAQQEPVGVVDDTVTLNGCRAGKLKENLPAGTKLYTSPRP